jgi:hypothetical protein
MKTYIYATLAIILGVISFNFQWFFDGQTAIAATKQVLTGFDYQAARTEMAFWGTIKSAVNVGFWVSVVFFITSFFPRKQTDK